MLVPGTGIGLFASRRVVGAQGGDIWYEESPRGGATFAFTVPLARNGEDGAERRAALPRGASPAERSGAARRRREAGGAERDREKR